MYKNVEFVCSGNNGRSPLAEMAARDNALKRGFALIISSSGTFVELPKDLTQYKGIIVEAVDKGILHVDDLAIFDTDPKRVIDELIEMEAMNRDAYLYTELDIDPKKRVRTPIRIRPEAELILTLGAGNLTKVKNLYAPSPYSPQIMPLEEFTRSYQSLEDKFPATYEEYSITAGKVWRNAVAAIDRIARMN